MIDAAPDVDAAPVDAAPPDAPVPRAISLTAGLAPPILGTFGDPFTDRCATGQALVGFHGVTTMRSTISVVGQVIGHCGALKIGTPRADGYAINSTTGVLLPARGADSTGVHWTVLCPTNQFVVGLAARAGNLLDQLALQCAPMTLVATDTGWAGRTGAVMVGDAVGGTGGVPLTALCPDGQVATVSDTQVVAASGTNPAVLGAIGVECSVVAGE